MVLYMLLDLSNNRKTTCLVNDTQQGIPCRRDSLHIGPLGKEELPCFVYWGGINTSRRHLNYKLFKTAKSRWVLINACKWILWQFSKNSSHGLVCFPGLPCGLLSFPFESRGSIAACKCMEKWQTTSHFFPYVVKHRCQTNVGQGISFSKFDPYITI